MVEQEFMIPYTFIPEITLEAYSNLSTDDQSAYTRVPQFDASTHTNEMSSIDEATYLSLT